MLEVGLVVDNQGMEQPTSVGRVAVEIPRPMEPPTLEAAQEDFKEALAALSQVGSVGAEL
jgi:hypothetical protein